MARGYGEDPVELFRRMLLIRRFEERAIELRMDNRIHGVIHPYIGEEATAVGVCSVLGDDDRIVSTHRGHGHCIAKGARPDRMMAELFGRVDGYCRGKGGSMHIAAFDVGMLGANGIVGGGLPIALGSALAAKMDNADVVTVAFFGDGATGEGSFHESMNLSSLWQLPVVWVCENNQYASETPVTKSVPEGQIARLAGGYGIPAAVVDGNDVFAVRAAALQAVDRARSGQGPTLLEAQTFRRLMHATRQNPPAETRPRDELDRWRARDPVDLVEAEIIRRDISAEIIGIMRTDIEHQLDEAIDFAEASPYPDPSTVEEDLWA